MRLMKLTISRFFLLGCALFFFFSAVQAQENSPFSRYGIGDIYPSQSIVSRAMGGLVAGVTDIQSINTANPGSYGFWPVFYGLRKPITYDIGVSIDSRTLRSAAPVGKYNSTNFLPSYLQLGIPLSTKRNEALVFGLRPASRVNYSVVENGRIPEIDSIQTLYEGNGGLNQVYFGLGKRWGGISVGVNAGYQFGYKNISTKVGFVSSSFLYYRSNAADSTNFWGVFLNPGVTAHLKLSEKVNTVTKNTETYYLNIGASGTLQQHLKANKDITRQTFFYGTSGEVLEQDSVFKQSNILGKIELPLNYTAGFMLIKEIAPYVPKWGFGVDYTAARWSDYRNFGSPDQLNDSWKLSVGGEFAPSPLTGKTLLNRATYRFGFYTGKDYINADGNGYKVQALTLGAAINLRKFNNYDKQLTLINTAIEFGKRGSKVNNITENFFKFSVGLSLSDIWFNKRKYD